MKSEAWSKGSLHPLQCIARRISGNHRECSHHRGTNTAAASNQRGYGKARQITAGRGEMGHTRWITERREKVYQWNLTTYFTIQQDRKYQLRGFQAPCSPLRGCLKVNSDTMLPGQRMLIDADKRLRVRAQLLLLEETIYIHPGQEDPVWETDASSLDQSELFWSHFFLNINQKNITLKSGLYQAEFNLRPLRRRTRIIVNVMEPHLVSCFSLDKSSKMSL